MFSNAVPTAAGFTRPVVISSRTTQGVCAGTIGAYVVVNRDGWILTAHENREDEADPTAGAEPAPSDIDLQNGSAGDADPGEAR